MSLFGDLPSTKNDAPGASSTAAGSWAAPQLQPSKRSRTTPVFAPRVASSAGRGGGRSGPGPVGYGRIPGGRGSSGGAGTADGQQASAGAAPMPSTSTIFDVHGNIKDEYDPMRPNEYEEVLKARVAHKREAAAEEERQAKIRSLDAVVAKLTRESSGGGGGMGGGSEGGGALTSPASNAAVRTDVLDISGEEAFLRRGRMGMGRGAPVVPAWAEAAGAGGGGIGAPSPSGSAPGSTPGGGLGFGGGDGGSGGGIGNGGDASAPRGMSLAQRMLEKMGWKEGDGLGRERQGMAAPLVAHKTDRRSGFIVAGELPASRARPEPEADGATAARMSGAHLVGKPSRVICLRNMVGPNEVDEELEEEVGNECTKYGEVMSVMIFEVTTPGYAPEESVRIFIQFDRVEAATKAQVDLQGRFFGGHNVRVAYFDEARFDKTDLAPAPGEFE
ncbi:hypothetical protein FOA52_002642 [Chlamydomonas sp. UWO 241]|nr:hypothetical protein FOA52_002642 [Chlamydomonas sp. UWO 241]